MNKRIENIYKAASIFQKHSQQYGQSKQEGDVFADILKALGVEVDDTGTPIDSSRRNWFNSNVVPWVQEEAQGRDPTASYGVKIIANPGNVQIVGTVNGTKGKASDKHFSKWSSAATKATNYEFEPFETTLFEEMTLG